MKEIEADKIFMEMSMLVAKFSKANRRKVGSLIVDKNGKIVATGRNGTPSEVDNSCEDEEGKTYDYVIHSEVNAIFNATTHDLEDATIYVTLSPCIRCAAAIIQKKFKRLVYAEEYRCPDGIEFLRAHGVIAEQIILD